MVVFSLRYDTKIEEVKLKTSDYYNNMPIDIKMDCLQDALCELQNKYDEEFKQSEREWNNIRQLRKK